MFRQFIDTLKEVFWIKSSRKRHKPTRRENLKKSPVKKKIVKRNLNTPGESVAHRLPGSKKVVDPSLVQVGVITHYFDRIKVCVVKLTQGTILIGDKLTILGAKTKFIQKVWSMQIESEDVKVTKKGQLIGLKVDKIVTVGDKVYK